MEQVEIDMAINGDATKARCLQRHGRFWTATGFKKLLDDITAGVALDPEIAPEVDLGLRCRTKTASCARTSSSILTH